MFRSVYTGIRFVGIGFAVLLSAGPLAAQTTPTSVCSLSDPNYQYCLYHGIGRQLGYEPSSTTELSATANWDQPNDGDLHGLLPQTETYSDPLIALPAFPLQPTQPFYPNATGSHIYPNHYQSQVNGGAAVATHSGDDGGGVATYAGQPGCDPATLTGVSCESIGITGEVPSGLYSFTLHAFPDTGTTFDPTNFDITVRATGNMVLTANSVATATPNSTSEVLIDPTTGVIRQVGTYQGTNNTTSRLDVYALNVGHAGHVGGVTIPQISSYLDTQGVQRWFPANPQDVDVSLPDQIAMQFQERDVLVDQYQDEARAELQRRYEAEQRRLARLREQYLAEQRRREQQQAQDEQPGLRLMFSPQYADIPSPVNPAYYDEWVASQEQKFGKYNDFNIIPLQQRIVYDDNPNVTFDRDTYHFYVGADATLKDRAFVLFMNTGNAAVDLKDGAVELNQEYKITTRTMGGLQTVGGGVEIVGGSIGVAGCTGGTAGIGAPGCVGVGTLIIANGVDNTQAGVRTLITGESTHTIAGNFGGIVAEEYFDADPETAEQVRNYTELGTSLPAIGQSLRNIYNVTIRSSTNPPYSVLSDYRSQNGLPVAGSSADNSTVAFTEIGGSRYISTNAHGEVVTGVNAISATHAEVGVLAQIQKSGVNVSGQNLTLYVDRTPCIACDQNGGIRSMVRQLGISELEVIGPEGSIFIKP